MNLRLFVSFSSMDGPDIASHIEGLFTGPEYEVFVSDKNIRAGDNWDEKIQENLEKCDIFVVIITRGILKSKYVDEKEVPVAIQLKKTIIPCRYEGIPRQDMKWGLEALDEIEWKDSPDLLRKLDNVITQQVDLVDQPVKEIDEKGPEIKSFVTGRPASEFRPSVIAERQGDKIVFRDRYMQFRVNDYYTITPGKFKTLDIQSRIVLRRYKKDMLQAFKDWDSWKESHQASYRNGQLDNESEAIIHTMCDNWTKIVKQLGRLGIRLEDHYYGIYGICDEHGYVKRV